MAQPARVHTRRRAAPKSDGARLYADHVRVNVDFEIERRIRFHRKSVIGRTAAARNASLTLRVLSPPDSSVGRDEVLADENCIGMADLVLPVRDSTAVASNGVRVEQALRSHLSLVWQVLRRSGLGTSDADDACQDVFWIFSQRSFDVPEAATRSFLVGTAVRVASDRRKSKWATSVTHSIDEDSMVATTELPDEQLQIRRQIHLLDEILAAMLPDEREIFILSEIEEMTRLEVARALGIPEGTVASRLRRAREHFDRLVRSRRARREARP